MRFHKSTLRVKSLHLPDLLSLQKKNRVSIVDSVEVLCLMSSQLGSAATRVSQSDAQRGGLSHFPPKFEHIFVAVITFFPFLLCRYFYYQLVAYCVCFKMICKKSLWALFLRRYSQSRKCHSKKGTSHMPRCLIPRRLVLQTQNMFCGLLTPKAVIWLSHNYHAVKC